MSDTRTSGKHRPLQRFKQFVHQTATGCGRTTRLRLNEAISSASIRVGLVHTSEWSNLCHAEDSEPGPLQLPPNCKASSGLRYIISFRPALPLAEFKPGVRVSLDMTVLTIIRIPPRELDPLVCERSLEDPGGATFAGINPHLPPATSVFQVVELHLMNPELLLRVGITPPKGVLPYGPPVPARLSSRERWLQCWRPISSSCLLRLWTGTLASRLVLCGRCSGTCASTNRASSSWTKSMEAVLRGYEC